MTSGVDAVEDVAVGVTAKMGLKPEASRGLPLAEAGPLPVEEATAETGVEEGAGAGAGPRAALWTINPKGPEFPAGGAAPDAAEVWLGSWVKAEGSETTAEEEEEG